MALRQAPGEVRAPWVASEDSNFYTAQDALAQAFMVPPQFLQSIRPEAGAVPEAPVIVFINARSGGRTGAVLALQLSRAIGRVQVFDLATYRPDKVLSALWESFKSAIATGVPNAAEYQRRLRILVAGGDGTIAWVLSEIKALKLHPAPPVAIMPLGTGNDLSRSFGWGPSFDSAWIKGYAGVYNTLIRVKEASIEDLDCWSASITIPQSELRCQMPHCIKEVQVPDIVDQVEVTTQVPEVRDEPGPHPARQHPERALVFRGLFWNYLSVGLDARSAYNFHQLRESSPAWASSRMMNQFWYSWFSCTSGWFCCAKGVSSKVELEVQRPGADDWIHIIIPDEIKAIVVLNLQACSRKSRALLCTIMCCIQSYAGGRNLWGRHTTEDSNRDGKLRFKEPSTNDGMLEIVGLLNGSHTACVMGTGGNIVHARRLCQASGVRMALRAKHVRPDGQPSHAYLQVDGEPWVQDVPSSKDHESIIVEVSHAGVSKLLHNRQALHNIRDVPSILRSASLPASTQRPLANASGTHNNGTRVAALSSAVASMAGTVADSEAVQVGSEPGDRNSSFQSNTVPTISARAELAMTQHAQS